MSKLLTVDPLTRIEGHMSVETAVESGKVSEVRIAGNMYRGFERMLLGRHPVDSARIAQRICGVCHEVHGVSSVMALEQIFGITPPANGIILRDMILGLHIVTDHILHFYNLCLPDYVNLSSAAGYNGKDRDLRNISDWLSSSGTAFMQNRTEGNYIKDKDSARRFALNYFEAIKIRSQAAGGLAILGAKVPFIHALMPGGITTEITTDALMKYYRALDATAEFVSSSFMPDVIEIAQRFPEYFDIGEAYNTFYAHQSFNSAKGDLFTQGVIADGEKVDFDYNKVKELIGSSYYKADGSPDENAEGAYSWIKAPRYDGIPLETGPIARAAVGNDEEFKSLLRRLGQKSIKSSVMGRLLARAHESVMLCNYLYGRTEEYVIGKPAIRAVDLQAPVSGEGIGFSVAARGALVHHITAYKGKVTDYKMIVPSTWNFGPTVDGRLGVAEKAVLGTPVNYGGVSGSIEVGRVIRSFDPCTACSIH
ncbi:Cytochrome-c3 hydrogenase [Denitrovibrio acetiphilus DSM 12809]|uniref:Cytochrome-c3 hydrogenase n=1 Tax=Denitrovibrio acetiphilus (strain DSM 12809 / NBRC 114555 / N2460) TaxID=522772 RepID=D4H4H9_DENA2|nr:nickel-dependent hydrogenase large subunit [Denitrovibrio acetiphilus]ADD69308.1 Cytochrome-c3 hydrogenase [Denitrovibrio acetiphilus DSM 12809]